MNTAERRPERLPESLDCSGLPCGVVVRNITSHRDNRGSLAELFRAEWPGLPAMPQWNFAENNSNVLRGMHVHVKHSDYLVVLQGELIVGLVDLRPESSTRYLRCMVTLNSKALRTLFIPPGVVHGFYSPNQSIVVWGMSHGWTMDDEIECHWSDPELQLNWPVRTSPVLSRRDTEAGSFSALEKRYLRAVA